MADLRSKRRLTIVTITLVIGLLGSVVYLLLSPESSFSYFKTVKEVRSDPSLIGKSVRVGGRVGKGSVQKSNEGYCFKLCEGKESITVVYSGTLPSTFGEGVQAIAEGKLVSSQKLIAKSLVTKCPSKYESQRQRSGGR
jgi:cytochrome c-type biogenesis protein CcmE